MCAASSSSCRSRVHAPDIHAVQTALVVADNMLSALAAARCIWIDMVLRVNSPTWIVLEGAPEHAVSICATLINESARQTHFSSKTA